MHAFWRETEEQVQQLEIVQFQKNTALIGGALLLFTLYGYAGVNFGLTLTSPLIHLSK